MAYNFSAGPTALPAEVMKEIQAEFLEFAGTKASAIEISHRSKEFMQVYYEMQADLRELMHIPDNYKILFTQGGASLQFSAIPLNFNSNTANYALTGHWSEKAIVEAQKYTQVNIVTDSTCNNFTDIAVDSSWHIDENAGYLHYCPNETIAGLEFDFIPEVSMPLVADMSSNILSAPLDVSKFGVIYAGAQKNIGAAGLTVVIVREDLIGHAQKNTPKLLNWQTYAENDSMFNTPVTFAWYSAYKVFKWLKKQGIENIYQQNQKKAALLYNAIDSSSFYSNPVNPKYRSIMNVPFILANDALNEQFLTESFEVGLLALKGHKSVGGMRASIYNAMPLEGVQALVAFMADFEKKYG